MQGLHSRAMCLACQAHLPVRRSHQVQILCCWLLLATLRKQAFPGYDILWTAGDTYGSSRLLYGLKATYYKLNQSNANTVFEVPDFSSLAPDSMIPPRCQQAIDYQVLVIPHVTSF